MSDPRAAYVAGRDARAAEAREAERKAQSIGTARVVVVLAALGILVGQIWGPLGAWTSWLIAGAVVLFGALVVVHLRVGAAGERASAASRFHARGLLRLDDKWSELPARGERFASAEHPYTDDLDIFGPASLFQRLDRTETRFGEERLAAWLSAASEPVDFVEVAARQAAVKDLAPRLGFRERLSAAGALSKGETDASVARGGGARPDPAPFLAWAEGGMPFESYRQWALVARVLPALAVLGVVATEAFHAPFWAWLVPVSAEALVLLATRQYVAPIAGAVSTREGAFSRFGEMLALLEAEAFEAEALRALQSRLRASGVAATVETARLERTLGFLDARNNEVWRLFLGPFLLWDLNCAISLEGWRARVGKHVRPWLEAVGEVEALASLAGLAFERPDHAFPEIVESPVFEAVALGHPLIAPARRVDNDVALKKGGFALVVTGSNMSGKSTLLRAIGVNGVLALAGGPVCARRLVLGPVRIAASMRVRDSLAEGVSRFYAEVRKLKAVIERARSGRVPATLFLLDEVLHGTNSRERLIGARSIVRELIARGALGGVSTHDLAIGTLEEELPGSVVNVHFEEQVQGDEMTFDYKLRPGVVHSSNALRIMRMVGIDVVLAE